MAAKIQRCGGSQPSPKAHHSSQQRTAPVSTSFPHTRQRGKARTPTPWAPSKPPRLASTAQAHARLSPPRDSQQPVTAQENPVPLCPARDVTASKVGGGKAAWVHTSHTGGRRERTRGEQIHTAWHHPTPHGTWVAYREVWPADSRPRMPHIRVGIQVRLPAPCPLTPLLRGWGVYPARQVCPRGHRFCRISLDSRSLSKQPQITPKAPSRH